MKFYCTYEVYEGDNEWYNDREPQQTGDKLMVLFDLFTLMLRRGQEAKTDEKREEPETPS